MTLEIKKPLGVTFWAIAVLVGGTILMSTDMWDYNTTKDKSRSLDQDVAPVAEKQKTVFAVCGNQQSKVGNTYTTKNSSWDLFFLQNATDNRTKQLAMEVAVDQSTDSTYGVAVVKPTNREYPTCNPISGYIYGYKCIQDPTKARGDLYLNNRRLNASVSNTLFGATCVSFRK